MTIKIGLVGEFRSGKDTVGDYLRSEYSFKSTYFAKSLYDVCRSLFPKRFEEGNKPRKLLQDAGSAMRQIDVNVWINKTIQEINEMGSDQIVVTDVRYPNEAERLRQEGFTLIKIVSPLEKRIERSIVDSGSFSVTDTQHESEKQVQAIETDYLINNDGSLLDLYWNVDRVMDRIGGIK